MGEAFQHLRAVRQEGVLVITPIHAELRSDTAVEQFQKELLTAIEQDPADKVVLDFRYVHTASSRAFGVIAGLQREFLRRQGGQVALCGLKPTLQESLSTIRFITGGSSAPLAAKPGAVGETPGQGRPEHKPMFEIVTPDVPSALAALSGEGKQP